MSPSTDTREYREAACELKFLIDIPTADAVLAWARTHLQPDPHAETSPDQNDGYRITSLYLDTEQFDVFHRRGSFGRSKYRIRRYGGSDLAFLERKLKTKGLLAKRRSTLDLARLQLLHDTTPVADPDAFWFHRRLIARALKPVCQISYQRTARFTLTQLGPIRLTVDHHLHALPAPRLAFSDPAAAQPILPDQRVLELKFRGDIPQLFKQLLLDFALAPSPFSKYRHAARTLGCVPEQTTTTATATPSSPHPATATTTATTVLPAPIPA